MRHAILLKRAGDAVGVAVELFPATLLALAGDGERVALKRGLTRECGADGEFRGCCVGQDRYLLE